MIPRKESKGVLRSGFFIFSYILFLLGSDIFFFLWQRDISRQCDDGARWTFQRPFLLIFFILLSFEQPQAKNKKAGSLRANDNVLEHFFLDTKESKMYDWAMTVPSSLI